MSEIGELACFQHDHQELMQSGEGKSIGEQPLEILDTGDRPFNALSAFTPIEGLGQIRAHEHKYHAGEGVDTLRVCKQIDDKTCNESDQILNGERQFKRQQQQGEEIQCRCRKPKQIDVAAHKNLQHYHHQKAQYVRKYVVQGSLFGFKSGFQRVNLFFILVLNKIYQTQLVEIGCQPDFNGKETGIISDHNLFDSANEQAFGEDIGETAGQNGVSNIDFQVLGNVLQEGHSRVGAFPHHGADLVDGRHHGADAGVGMQNGNHGGEMVGDIAHNPHDTGRRSDSHVLADSILAPFVHNDVVVSLIGSLEDDVGVRVVVEACALSMHRIRLTHHGERGILLNDEHVVMLAHQGDILLHQLLVLLSQTELVHHFRPVLLDWSRDALADASELVAAV